jgi:hypothetical protein
VITTWEQNTGAPAGLPPSFSIADARCGLRGDRTGGIVGTFIEPVTRRPRSWPLATRLAIGLNLAASAALVGAGAWHAAAARCQYPGRGRR